MPPFVARSLFRLPGYQRKDRSKVIGLEDGCHLRAASPARNKHVVPKAMTFLQKEKPLTGKIQFGGLCLTKCVFLWSHKNKGLT